jgi:hypothetical protein
VEVAHDIQLPVSKYVTGSLALDTWHAPNFSHLHYCRNEECGQANAEDHGGESQGSWCIVVS